MLVIVVVVVSKKFRVGDVGSVVRVTTFGGAVGVISDIGVAFSTMGDVGDVAVAADGAGAAVMILV